MYQKIISNQTFKLVDLTYQKTYQIDNHLKQLQYSTTPIPNSHKYQVTAKFKLIGDYDYLNQIPLILTLGDIEIGTKIAPLFLKAEYKAEYPDTNQTEISIKGVYPIQKKETNHFSHSKDWWTIGGEYLLLNHQNLYADAFRDSHTH